MDIKSNDYKKIIICLVLIFAVFVLISNTYFNAKYRTRISGNDNTMIAKWNVGINTDNNLAKLYLVSESNLENENNTNSYQIIVNNTSEVTAKYSIVISNVPSDIQVKLDDGMYRGANNDGIITFSNVGTFLVGDNTPRTNILTFRDLISSNNQGDLLPMTIDVYFEQVDHQ